MWARFPPITGWRGARKTISGTTATRSSESTSPLRRSRPSPRATSRKSLSTATTCTPATSVLTPRARCWAEKSTATTPRVFPSKCSLLGRSWVSTSNRRMKTATPKSCFPITSRCTSVMCTSSGAAARFPTARSASTPASCTTTLATAKTAISPLTATERW